MKMNKLLMVFGAVVLSMATATPTFADTTGVISDSQELANAQSKNCAALYPKDAVKYSACMKGEKAPDDKKKEENK